MDPSAGLSLNACFFVQESEKTRNIIKKDLCDICSKIIQTVFSNLKEIKMVIDKEKIESSERVVSVPASVITELANRLVECFKASQINTERESGSNSAVPASVSGELPDRVEECFKQVTEAYWKHAYASKNAKALSFSEAGRKIVQDIETEAAIIGELSERASEFLKKMMGAVWKDIFGCDSKDIFGCDSLVKSINMIKTVTKDHPNLTGTLVLAKSISPILDLIEVLDGRAPSIVDDAIAS